MNYTYKTNKYKLSLINVVGTTLIDSSFYVRMIFICQEWTEDYVWFLQQLWALYHYLNISYSLIVITDCDTNLMTAIH